MTLKLIVEYGTPELITDSGKSKEEINQLFKKLNIKFKKNLGLRNEPFQITEESNGIKIRAGEITGQLRIGKTDLMIIPKYLATQNMQEWSKSLLKMLHISRTTSFLPYHITKSSQGELNFIDLIATYFAENLSEAIERGQPIGYQEKQMETNYFRGRMDVRRQSLIMFTKPNLIAIRASVMTNDIPLTRLLKWACMYLEARVRSPLLRQRLSSLIENFAGVSNVLPSLGSVERLRLGGPQIQFTKPFSIALWLAKKTGQIFYPKMGEMPGILLNSEDVFQHFISGCIQRIAIGKSNWRPHKVRSFLLASGPIVDPIYSIPDDVIYINNKIAIVLDSKYKGRFETDIKLEKSDLDQMNSACRATVCKKGMLVYPSSVNQDVIGRDIVGAGNPEKIFTMGINPTLLSEKDGFEKIKSFLEKNISSAITS